MTGIEIEEIIKERVRAETNQLEKTDQRKQPVALGYAIESAAKIIARVAAKKATRDKVSYLLPEKGSVLAINAASTREVLQKFLNTFVFIDGAKCVVDRVDPANNSGLAIMFHDAPIEKEES